MEGSLQERVAPWFGCFGCGPANTHGLRIACYPDGDAVVAEWLPEAHHQGPPDILHGGLIGALFDCHGAWTAVHHLMLERATEELFPIVTAEYAVRLRRPTPLATVRLRGRVTAVEGRRFVVASELRTPDDEVSATFEGRYAEMRSRP